MRMVALGGFGAGQHVPVLVSSPGLCLGVGGLLRQLRGVGLDLLLDGAYLVDPLDDSARRPRASRPSAASARSAIARSSAARPTRPVAACHDASSCPAVRTAAASAGRPAGLLRTCRTARSFRDAAGLFASTVPPVSGPEPRPWVAGGLINSRRRMHVSAVARGLPGCGSRNRAPMPSAARFVWPVRGGSRPGRRP